MRLSHLLCSLLVTSTAHASDLLGPDLNRNGIRDDVEQLTTLPGAPPSVTAAREGYARSIQRLVAGDARSGETDPDPLITLFNSGLADWAVAAQDIRARTLNTPARLKAYAAATNTQRARLMPLTPTADCAQSCTVVIFQNGILTPEEAALNGALALRRLVGDAACQQPVTYAVNYNPTEGLQDFLEVFRQKFGETDASAATFAQHFGDPSQLSAVASGLLSAKLAAAVPSTPLGWLQALTQPGGMKFSPQQLIPTPGEVTAALQAYLDAYVAGLVRATVRLRDRVSSSTYMDANAARLTDGVERYLRRGARVVLVSHSQGNLYAEVLVRELKRRQVPMAGFATVGIAVPNGLVPAGGPYVTTRADLVLGALRLAFPVLDANDQSVPAGEPGAAFLGHGFVDVYTNPKYAVSTRVASAVRQAIEQVGCRGQAAALSSTAP